MGPGYFVSDTGKALLEQMAQDREERAQDHAEKRRAEKIQIVSAIIGAVVGSVLTLFVEHFFEILEFLRTMFS